jgi:hypothetical protein
MKAVSAAFMFRYQLCCPVDELSAGEISLSMVISDLKLLSRVLSTRIMNMHCAFLKTRPFLIKLSVFTFDVVEYIAVRDVIYPM